MRHAIHSDHEFEQNGAGNLVAARVFGILRIHFLDHLRGIYAVGHLVDLVGLYLDPDCEQQRGKTDGCAAQIDA